MMILVTRRDVIEVAPIGSTPMDLDDQLLALRRSLMDAALNAQGQHGETKDGSFAIVYRALAGLTVQVVPEE